MPQRKQLASTPEPPLPKAKEQSHLSKTTNCMVNESQGEQEPHLGEGERDQAGAWRGKSGLHNEGRQVPKRWETANKKSIPRRSRRKHERVRGRKALQEDLQCLGFTLSLVKPEMGKEVGRRARSYDDRAKWVRVTRKGVREASKKRSGIGEDEKQQEVVWLAARWRCSDLVILVTLKKGNHPGES